jgi:pimeloyl-ACP methyl ester carboxylesterase
MYEYQFTQLPRHGYRCIGITQRGFGRSSKPWGEYNYDVFADDLKKVIKTLGLHNITLAGHSMGGAVAVHYMARHKGAEVSKLALFGAAAPSFTIKKGFPYGLETSAVDGLIKTCYEDRSKLNLDIGKIFFRSENAVSQKLADWFYNMGMEASADATAACLATLRDADLRSDMEQVKVPTAIFHATQDKICGFALAEAMAVRIKGSKLVRFENSGHGLFYEEKDKFNRELINFAG